MPDTTVTIEAPMPNSPEARTPTGELKDVSQTTTTTSTETIPETKPEPTPTETKPEIKPEAGAPEKYEDFKLPDGVKLEGETLKAATDLFKELGLPQANAQRLVDFHIAQLKAAAEAPDKALDDMRADWKTKSEADPDIGPKAKAIKETVGRALDTLGDAKLVADFRSLMDLTGAGDHPAFIKVIAKFAERVVEGRHVAGAQPSKFGQTAPGTNERPTAAQALYPNNP